MLRGMETQLTDYHAHIPAALASAPSIRIALLFTRVFLSGAPLLKLPSVKLPAIDNPVSAFRADPQRLMAAIPALHELYEYFLALAPGEINAFTGVEWGALILAVILGFRMSLPLVVCPEWDDGVAREKVRFGEYIGRFCGLGRGGGGGGVSADGIGKGGDLAPASSGGGQGKSVDVVSASRIVLEMVGRKFRKRVARLEAAAAAAAKAVQERQQQQQQQQPEPEPEQYQQQHHQRVEAMLADASMPTPTGRGVVPAHSGCPMMDGSLEQYYPYWDETFNSNLVANAFATTTAAEASGQCEMDPAGVGVPNDLWTSMTMGWAQGGSGFDGL